MHDIVGVECGHGPSGQNTLVPAEEAQIAELFFHDRIVLKARGDGGELLEMHHCKQSRELEIKLVFDQNNQKRDVFIININL